MFEFTWDIDPIAFSLGPVEIRWYGLIFLCVFLGGYALFRWQVLRGGGSEDDAADIFVPAILGVLIGARLGHVLFYEMDKALADPLWVFQIWKGGLASHGATVGLLVAIWVYARMHRQSWIESLDRFAFSAALGAALVRLGNFMNSEIVGRVTDGTWGVRFPRHDHPALGALAPLRHPSQLYEFAMGISVMGILWIVDRATGREQRPRGVLIWTFFIAYFIGRFCVEFFKEYQTLATSSALTMGQILSIPMALFGLAMLLWSLRRGTKAAWNLAPVEAQDSRAVRRRQTRKKGRK